MFITKREQSKLNALLCRIDLPQRDVPMPEMISYHPSRPADETYMARVPFVVIKSGLRLESEEAIAEWWDGMKRYAEGKFGVLCWRNRPEISAQTEFASGKVFWLVYSRLAIVPEDVAA